MAKLGLFWYSKTDIFACTIRKGRPCFDWCLEASKTGNDRVPSWQKINKKLLKTTRTKKAASTDFARSQVYWNWEVTFGIYAIWLLISGHHFTIFLGHSCHLAFECQIWGISLPFVSFGVWLLAGEVLVWFGLLVCFECTDIWYKLFKLIAHSKVAHPTWEPLGEIFKWLVNLLLWSNDKKNGLKLLDLYWHRMGKWTEVPLRTGLPLVINSQGLIKLRCPTSPEG